MVGWLGEMCAIPVSVLRSVLVFVYKYIINCSRVRNQDGQQLHCSETGALVSDIMRVSSFRTYIFKMRVL